MRFELFTKGQMGDQSRLMEGLSIVLITLGMGIPILMSGCQPQSRATVESPIVSTDQISTRPIPTETIQPSITPSKIPTITPEPTLGIGSTDKGSDGAILVYVPAGKFVMGGVQNLLDRIHENQEYDWIKVGGGDSNYKLEDAEPIHDVSLGAFWIDQTEVTIHRYKQCVESRKCSEPAPKGQYNIDHNFLPYYENPDRQDYPVNFVTWEMAKSYCEWAGRRLPTEAEWEKAARSDDQRMFTWGNDLPSFETLGNEISDTGTLGKTGQFPKEASPYGVMDMNRNVSEWVADWFSPTYYSDSPGENPTGPESGVLRVARGANFNSQFNNGELFITLRGSFKPDETWASLGFRCAVSVD